MPRCVELIQVSVASPKAAPATATRRVEESVTPIMVRSEDFTHPTGLHPLQSRET